MREGYPLLAGLNCQRSSSQRAPGPRPVEVPQALAPNVDNDRAGAACGHPDGRARSVAVLLKVVDREVLALRRVRKGSVAELLDDWHELVLGEAVECLSGLPEVDHAQPPSIGPAE